MGLHAWVSLFGESLYEIQQKIKTCRTLTLNDQTERYEPEKETNNEKLQR